MRPSKDVTWMKLARDLSEQSTCLRRAVGCVLIGVHGDVIGTGWNGVAPGQPHCNEEKVVYDGGLSVGPGGAIPRGIASHVEHPHACPGARSPSGTNLDACRALHAEANALVSCRVPFEIATCYVTASPCTSCAKMLLRTPCTRIVFAEPYPAVEARKLWVAAGRAWEELDI